MFNKEENNDMYELYKSGESIPEVSLALNIPISTLWYKFMKKGILRSRHEGIKLAAKKGRMGSGLRGVKRVFSEDHKAKIKESKIIHGNKYAKGISLKPNGYIEITRGGNKGRGQHVVIMEEFIGRKLVHGECVHHINKNRSDNRIENLRLMTRSEHTSFHRREYKCTTV